METCSRIQHNGLEPGVKLKDLTFRVQFSNHFPMVTINKIDIMFRIGFSFCINHLYFTTHRILMVLHY